MDLFIARQPATQTTRKADLLLACENTGITPRPNWVHPNPREFLAQLELLCAAYGTRVGDPLPHALMPGTQTSYTTAKSWPVTDSTSGETRVVTWDSLTGEVHGNFRGMRWREFALAMPDAIDRAYELAEVLHNNVIDQIAIALMQSMPCAPFVSSGLPGKQRNSLWIAAPIEQRDDVEDFFRIIGRPLVDGMATSGSPRARIEASCTRGCQRLARGSGWVKICQDSHQLLLDIL